MRSLPLVALLVIGLIASIPQAVWAQSPVSGNETAHARAEALAGHLPPALEGWSRTVDPAALSSAGMFGIVSAKATYWAVPADDPRDEFTRMMERVPFVAVSLWADPPAQMVAQIDAQRRMAVEQGMGRVEEIGGESFVVSPLGDLQALVAGSVALTISGMASAEEKRAHLDRIDMKALKENRP